VFRHRYHDEFSLCVDPSDIHSVVQGNVSHWAKILTSRTVVTDLGWVLTSYRPLMAHPSITRERIADNIFGIERTRGATRFTAT